MRGFLVVVLTPCCTALRLPAIRMSELAPGSNNLLVIGNGPVQCLTARLAAIRGFTTTIAVPGEDVGQAEQMCFDDNYGEGSTPLSILPISGDAVDESAIEAAIKAADGMIIAFDRQEALLSERAFEVFVPPDSKVKHLSLMSRYLNGEGMGFFPNAAKVAANSEIWNAPKPSVEAYKEMEEMVAKRAAEVGATMTTIRAGTLKGGASGDKDGEGGEKSFLGQFFYTLGQQDVVNWRLLYDCAALGVEVSKGDTLPGPGFTAALTATSETGGDGDSHRGAVASALVESLRTPAADDQDFSIKSVPGREFPSPEAMKTLLEKAA